MTTKARHAIRIAMVVGALGAGALAVPVAASANLGGCSSDITSERTGTAYCSVVSVGSHFRVLVTCVKYTNGAARTVPGPWRYTPTQSAATCLSGEYAADAIVDTVY